MSPTKAEPKSTGISIGGNVNTGGGSIAGRDVHNVSVHIEAKRENINRLFLAIYKAVETQNNLTNEERGKINQKIQVLESEASKNKPSDTKVAKLLTDIAKMSPDILEVVVAAISNPLVGLATVAHKISQKAKG